MSFNQLLGFTVSHLHSEHVEIKLVRDDKLMGNPVHNQNQMHIVTGTGTYII
ncbi:hypothetical protein GARC_3054 [Paraglaciecola arctica BSs20135]|uniref:Uncharacterized protein n=1 Tax=Paraglaciecola arctica BSs20135 TaxID=493475 RepID=K6YPB1_9ALTE|nr:hypothetical protein GARC_3054 [Paraglaciecola arctica BSs20135]